MKSMVLFVIIFASVIASANCQIGKKGRVVETKYQFCSDTTGQCRILSHGTLVTVTDVGYTSISGYKYLANLQVLIESSTKTIVDPNTHEAYSCTSLIRESGYFKPQQAGFFSNNILQCLL